MPKDAKNHDVMRVRCKPSLAYPHQVVLKGCRRPRPASVLRRAKGTPTSKFCARFGIMVIRSVVSPERCTRSTCHGLY